MLLVRYEEILFSLFYSSGSSRDFHVAFNVVLGFNKMNKAIKILIITILVIITFLGILLIHDAFSIGREDFLLFAPRLLCSR